MGISLRIIIVLAYCWSSVTTIVFSGKPIKYRGCFLVRSKTSLLNDGVSHTSTTHTPDTCISFCSSKNFSFAGIEKHECRCGHHVPSDLLKRSNAECNLACHGSNHKIYKCGGKSKVSIYETGVKIVEHIPSRVYLGCFKDANVEFRVLKGSWQEFPSDNSPKKCHLHCFRTGFRFFGLTYQKECFCGDTIPSLTEALSEAECDSRCSGDASEICGGGWRLSLYATGLTNDPEIGRSLGCFKNLQGSEFKPQHKFELLKSNTNQKCLNMCSMKGYKYSGIENKTECICSNTPPHVLFLDADSKCNKHECPGDPTETCGGTNRVKVYQTRQGDVTPLPEASYLGCYEDRIDFRVIGDFQVNSINELTGKLCADICREKGYAFSGLEAGNECFCSHMYPSPALRSAEDDCSLPCEGNPNERCGGLLRIAVYHTGLPRHQARVTSQYMGCYLDDNKDNRLLKGSWQQLENNSPEICHKVCLKNGFLYFGLTWIKECFCGDEDPSTKGQVLSEEECNKECGGDSNKKCGGGWRLSVYKTGLEELPQENEYMGCFQNDGSLLSDYSVLLSSSNSPKRCVRVCDQMQYLYAGVERGDVCRCGNEQSKYLPEDDTQCSFKCSGAGEETCGASNYVQIYRTTIEVGLQTSSIYNISHKIANKCKPSDTTKTGKSVCKYEMLLDETFDTLNTARWKHTVKMGGDPDYEFVTYSSSPNVTFVKDGILHIQPMLQSEDFVYGKQTLSGCTGVPKSAECTKTATGFNILPPVLSGKITTERSFSFRFGRIDIRAKLPTGDWIVPQIWLSPKDSLYGPKYTSGQIRIALVYGNKDLKCDGVNMGSRTLQTGLVLGPPNFIGRVLSVNESKEEWSKHFHNFSLVWTTDNLNFYVDGKFVSRILKHPSDTVLSVAKLPHNSRYIWDEGSTRLAPFDKEFYITLGVSVGGVKDFADTCLSNGNNKPWTNTSPKAMNNFWSKRSEWSTTWSGLDSALQVDHIKVAAI